jgi:hypothetical protein
MTNWMEIATELHDALASFMARDGTGKGGAADQNLGDWKGADKAVEHFDYALRTVEIPMPQVRYHYSTWGNGPRMGKLVPDSLEECEDIDCKVPEHCTVVKL